MNTNGLEEMVQGFLGGVDLRLVMRGLEFGFSFISWTVMSSAQRSGYAGYFEYDNYTPLNFVLAVGIIHWGYVIALVAIRLTRTLDPDSTDKLELYGTALMAAFMYTAAIAGSASSSQLHDKFGSYATSVCKPKPHFSSREKAKAAYFCSRVDASVVFAWFAACAAAVSLRMVLKSQQSELTDDDGLPVARPNAYNPIIGTNHSDNNNYPAFHASGIPMEGLGADSNPMRQDDSAVDL